MPRQTTPDRRATLKEVAAEAGVSLSTASLVFSGRGPVSEQTRTKVLAAAQRLSYSGPDPVAANLRRGRSGVVAVVLHSSVRHALRDPYALSVVDGLAEVLDQIPVGMLLIAHPGGDVQELIERLRSTALDAVVFYSTAPTVEPAAEYLRDRGVPVITVDGPTESASVAVHIDERAAIGATARHLTDLGHTRFATLTLPIEVAKLGTTPAAPCPAHEVTVDTSAYVTRERLLGVMAVVGDEVPCAVATGVDIADGALAIAPLLDLPPSERPTAIIAQSDMLAMGVIQAAVERDLRVPEDLSVTGFDGIPIPWWPGTLTSVVQPGGDKGRQIGDRVKALIEDEPVTDLVLTTELRVGTSTAPPPDTTIR